MTTKTYTSLIVYNTKNLADNQTCVVMIKENYLNIANSECGNDLATNNAPELLV